MTITEIFSGVDQTTFMIAADMLKAAAADFYEFKACFSTTHVSLMNSSYNLSQDK